MTLIAVAYSFAARTDHPLQETARRPLCVCARARVCVCVRACKCGVCARAPTVSALSFSHTAVRLRTDSPHVAEHAPHSDGTCACESARASVHASERACVCVCVCECECVCASACACACACACVRVRAHACACVRVCTRPVSGVRPGAGAACLCFCLRVCLRVALYFALGLGGFGCVRLDGPTQP